jgi:hypothetical protein
MLLVFRLLHKLRMLINNIFSLTLYNKQYNTKYRHADEAPDSAAYANVMCIWKAFIRRLVESACEIQKSDIGR